MSAPPGPDAARDPQVTAWVSANAGAGKTHILADRVTRLLLEGTKPSQILCLTYTKAAAAEMSGRLFDRLGAWALLPDKMLEEKLAEIGAAGTGAEKLRQARRLFAEALETPGGLKIQTIHSFCQHVLARFPVEAGVPARFAVADERSAAAMMGKAQQRVLERAAGGEAELADAVAVLAVRAADGRFSEILSDVTAHPGRLRGILERHGGDRARFFSHLRAELGIAEGEDEEKVVSGFCAGLTGEREKLLRTAKWLLSGSTNDKKKGNALETFASTMRAGEFETLRGVFLKKDGEPLKTLATKDTAAAEPELNAYLADLGDRVRAAEARRKGAAVATLTEALVKVALNVLDEYDAAKRARAALDYDDLTRKTQQLLERKAAAAWVHWKLDHGIDHVLVDEAQDTSPEQWAIVRALTGEFFAGLGADDGARRRTLFAVGDEKQSIFSFQGADPAEFGRNRAGFRKRVQDAQFEFADVPLPISRRSARSILTFVDEVFSSHEMRDGLTSMDGPILHEPHRAEQGRVELWPSIPAPDEGERDPWNLPVDAPSPSGAHVVLASRIADRIAGWIADGATLPGTEEAITPGDIMILVRRRNAFAEEMIRQLLERRIDVAGADRMVLSEQIAIADLAALGHFALLPEDDLNLASLLKAPFIGFGEDELYALAAQRRSGLWEALAARQSENKLFAAAYKFLAEALASADFRPPFEFFARILSHGARKRIVARLGAEADDAIDEFLSLAQIYEASYPPSLEGFLHWFGRSASEIKRDMEQAGSAVRVMTVHGAKGLQSRIVIVPDTAQAPDFERRGGILYTDDCLFFNVPKAEETSAVGAAKAAAQLREMHEYRRLLYVALTRACDWLILCGYETKRGVNAQSWYPGLEAAAKRIGRAETDEAGETICACGLEPGKIAVAPGKEGTESKLPEFLARPPKTTAAKQRIIRPSDAAGEGEPALNSPVSEKGDTRFSRGLLMHTLFAALPAIAPDKREAAALKYLALHGAGADESKDMFEEVQRVLDHADFAALFGPESRGEITVTAELNELGEGARISGQIDRLAVTAEKILIADFKTNRPPPKTVEETPALYRAQMALYRAALAKIYPGRKIACALVWTDGAQLMELPDYVLDAEIARIAARLQESPAPS